MPKLATTYNCTGCMACKDICPRSAIHSHKGEDGHRYVYIDQTSCIECKLCEKICPITNGYNYGDNSLDSDFYAGWSTDKKIRANGATSGIFGTIANYFLTQKGWVAGAIMDNLECRYIITNSLDDLPKLQGSKYTSSDPSNIYKVIHNKLKVGEQVLFGGLPCHVSALLNYIPKYLHDRLYTIDIICGGVSSPLLIKEFSKNTPGLKSIISFRNKNNGWKADGYRYSLTYQKKDGTIISEAPEKRNIVTDGFALELTNRYSCYRCKFNGIHRKCDITIGDLWKDINFKSQHYNGVSAIICHTKKGISLINSTNIKYNIVEPIQILKSNHRIFNGMSCKRYLLERRMIGFIFKSFSYKTILKIYANKLRPHNIIWWPFMLYRVVSFKIINCIHAYRDQKLLNRILK